MATPPQFLKSLTNRYSPKYITTCSTAG